jgi:hypothetical protein
VQFSDDLTLFLIALTAMDGIPALLQTFTLSIPGNSISDFIHHPRSETIPGAQLSTSTDVQAIKHAIGSLSILHSLMINRYFHKDQLDELSELPDLVHAAWQDIWRWLAFLHTKCIVNQAHGETIMHASLHVVPLVLASFGWHTGLRLSMIRTPGLISMLTKHWLKEDTYAKQPELAWGEHQFARALENLFTYGNGDIDTDPEVVAAITCAPEGGAAVVAQMALQQFNAVLQPQYLNVANFDVISLFLTLIYELSDSHPTLRPSLLHQGIIPTITYFLRNLHLLHDESTLPSAVERSVMMASGNLVKFMQTVKGPSFIVQGLDGGL